jgi:protein-S-isoprenylcysteine O-methyltransferase Ste14
MYVAVSLFGAGMALNNLNWITVALWTALIVTLIFKARFEDKLLLKIHPEAVSYQKKRFKGGR